MSQPRSSRPIALASLLCCTGMAVAQTQGPDIIVGDLPDVTQNAPAAVNGVTYQSYAVGTTSCNKGNTPVLWFTGGTDNRHPAISQNVYRYIPSLNRFEQIGQGELKHGFTALQGSTCTSYFGFGCTATAGTTLGVGCSDPYGSGLNNVTGSGGARWQVNAATGLFPYPPNVPTNSGPPRVRLSDLNNAVAGTRYFIEGQYIVGDDAAYGTGQNKNNNASWREINFNPVGGTPPAATSFNIALSSGSGGVVHREQPAIYAWQSIDPTVQIATYDVPGDGRFVLGAKVTGPVGGLYTYEYALHNLNSHRCAGSFIVPLPGTQNALTNVGFHGAEAVAEPNALPTPTNPNSGDWAMSGSGAGSTQVSWAGPAYFGTAPVYVMDASVAFKVATFTAGTGNDHTANVIRWANLFNFRFTSEVAPVNTGSIAVGLWRPGNGTAFVLQNVPTPGGALVGNLTATCCNAGVCSITTQAACGAGIWGQPGSTCSPDPCVQGTCCISGVCSSTLLGGCTGTWSAGGSCSPNPCPVPSGACCTASSCSVVLRPSCTTTYIGDNSTCAASPCPPANDRCANAIWMADGVAIAGNTTAATFTSGDGTANCGASGSTSDVWYKYRPATTGTVTFAMCGSSYDTVLSAHSGSCGGLTQLMCNDDSCGLQSQISVSLTANTTYLIRVSGYSGATGVFTLTATGGGGTIPTGACCSSGSCTSVAQAACPGTYQGDGSSCSPNPCAPATGACCNGTSCSTATQAACTGTYMGNATTCGTTGNPTACCPANYNGINGISVQDIFDFLTGYFALDPRADFNHVNGITVQDIFDFLAAYFTGC